MHDEQSDRERLSARPKSLGLSQTQFAGFLGVALSTVRAWELGQRKPSGPARWLLGEIRDDPASWRAKLARKTGLKRESPEP
jgi:putative transcriptional regulator